ncbi:Rrf2 family transcriptional regulator [Streptomyces fungicidicus]|uniref:Rrf2 family transcriptional regulator n=1 Tax=Streptomyces fungicidicus TaxID=68203 RepID=A0ACC7Y4V1_9ACTN|nr:Rrf2 family transcriptional regulator [Streptomyces fungicidicus]
MADTRRLAGKDVSRCPSPFTCGNTAATNGPAPPAVSRPPPGVCGITSVVHISAAADYATHALLELAREPDRPLTCESIASSQGLPFRFLQSVVGSCARPGGCAASAGARASTAGAAGRITLPDVSRAEDPDGTDGRPALPDADLVCLLGRRGPVAGFEGLPGAEGACRPLVRARSAARRRGLAGSRGRTGQVPTGRVPSTGSSRSFSSSADPGAAVYTRSVWFCSGSSSTWHWRVSTPSSGWRKRFGSTRGTSIS